MLMCVAVRNARTPCAEMRLPSQGGTSWTTERLPEIIPVFRDFWRAPLSRFGTFWRCFRFALTRAIITKGFVYMKIAIVDQSLPHPVSMADNSPHPFRGIRPRRLDPVYGSE